MEHAIKLPAVLSKDEAGLKKLENLTWIQVVLGWLFFIPFSGFFIGLLKWGLRYRVENLKEMRALYKSLRRKHGPLLICANHLTYIDPILIIYALGNHFWYWFNFRALTWNFPATEYRKKNLVFSSVCFLNKCVYIDRKGGRSHHNTVLEFARQLLIRGEPVTLFPEGTRSKSGRFEVEKLKFGIGRLVEALPEARVLCLYFKADRGKPNTSFPSRGARFRFKYELLEFGSSDDRSSTTVIEKIGKSISAMEAEYEN